MSKKNINEEELLARQIMLMNTFITLIPEEKKTVYTTYKQRLVTKLKNDLGPAIKDFKAGDDLIKTLVDNNPNIDSLLYDGEEGSRAVDEIKLKLQDWKVSLALSGLRVKNSDINALRSNSKALIAFVKKFDSNIPDINLGNQNEQPGKTIPANVTMLLDTPIEGNFSNASTEILEQLLNSETFCAAVENFINERESKKQQEVVVDAIEQPQTQENKQEVSVVERHRSDSMPTSNAITENPAAENPVVSKVAETETYYTTTVPETEASSKETPAAPQTVTAEEAQPTQKSWLGIAWEATVNFFTDAKTKEQLAEALKDNNKLKDDLLDLGATDEKNQTNNDIYRIEINHLNDQLKKQNEQILKQLETIASITGEKFEQETATVSITNISAKTSENTPLTEEQVTAENPTKKKTIGESIYEFIRSITKSQTQEILENTQKENDALKEKKNKLTKKVLEQTVINKSLNNQIAELRKLSEEKKSMIEKNETTIAKKTTEKEEELINAKEVEEAELIKAKKEATNQNPDDKSHQAIEKTPEISQTTTTDHTDTQKTQQQTKEEKRALQRFAEQTLNITKKVSSFLTGTYNNKRTLNHKSDSSKENTNTHS